MSAMQLPTFFVYLRFLLQRHPFNFDEQTAGRVTAYWLRKVMPTISNALRTYVSEAAAVGKLPQGGLSVYCCDDLA